MQAKERISTKQCPQCGFSAEGQRLEEGPDAVLKRVPPPPKYEYDCGNCGFQWVA